MDGVPRVPGAATCRGIGGVALQRARSGARLARRGFLAHGSPQQRALLAALLLREGRTATSGQLIDALWGEESPPQALAAVRTNSPGSARPWTPAS